MMKMLILVNSLTLQTLLPHSHAMKDILFMDLAQDTVQYQIQTRESGLRKHQLAKVMKLKDTVLFSAST